MPALLWRTGLRNLLAHPWQTGLSVLGVALGVALIVGIDTANTSANRAFGLSAEGVMGKTTHQIVGSARGLQTSDYTRLKLQPGLPPLAPVIEGYATAPAYPGRTFTLLGVDPLAEGAFRDYFGTGLKGDRATAPELPLAALLTESGSIVMAGPTAKELGIKLNDTLGVNVGGRHYLLRITALLEPRDENTARILKNMILTDISSAQEALGMEGRISRIDVVLPENKPATEMALRHALPSGLRLEPAQARTARLAEMTRAFSLNLTALSLLALLVGMLLIYNTTTFSVLRRYRWIGALRAVGVLPREVLTLMLAEAVLVGIVGATLGALLGVVLGSALTQLIAGSINDLYFVISVESVGIEPFVLLKGISLGVLATLASAFVPAREAANIPPRAALTRSGTEDKVKRGFGRLWAIAGLLVLAGFLLLAFTGHAIAPAYIGLLCWVLAFAFLCPIVTVGLMHLLGPLVARIFGLLGAMAARGIIASLSRTAIAIAALTVAVAATIGVGVMVDSFRQTVWVWLSGSLEADLYLSPPTLVQRNNEATLDSTFVQNVRRAEGVAEVSTFRSQSIDIEGHPASLLAPEMAKASYHHTRIVGQGGTEVWAAYRSGDVIISEPFAYRFQKQVGDAVRLLTDRGERAFRIAGIFYDYGSDLGIVMIDRSIYNRFWDDRGISGMGIFAQKNSSSAQLEASIRHLVPPGQQVIIRQNKALLANALMVFDRTFAITGALKVLTLIVAFVGVLSAMMALQLERARELAVMRATGLLPRQVYGLVTLQTGLMGLVAGLCAIPLGLLMAYVLVFVINRRSFGWTLQFQVSLSLLLQGLLLAVVAAVVAGLYPAWRMARTPPALALREE